MQVLDEGFNDVPSPELLRDILRESVPSPPLPPLLTRRLLRAAVSVRPTVDGLIASETPQLPASLFQHKGDQTNLHDCRGELCVVPRCPHNRKVRFLAEPAVIIEHGALCSPCAVRAALMCRRVRVDPQWHRLRWNTTARGGACSASAFSTPSPRTTSTTRTRRKRCLRQRGRRRCV